MNIIVGRDNFATTIYVPYDCSNTCKFCSSKSLYKKCSMASLEEMKEAVKKYCSMKLVKDVVFTGGEPMDNIDILTELVEAVPESKNVYINTTFIQKNAYKFIKLVNSTKKIKGVNISRHDINIDEDRKFLSNICDDDFINFIEKPIKINVVLSHAVNSIAAEEGLESFILKCCERWQNFNNLTLSFREDFKAQEEAYLHQMKTNTTELFFNNMEFKGHSFCEVCDTMKFEYDNCLEVQYHRGLEHSSINLSNQALIVNDLIVFPNGKAYYDWDKKDSEIESVLEKLSGKRISKKTTSYVDSTTGNTVSKTHSTKSASSYTPYGFGSCGFRSC